MRGAGMTKTIRFSLNGKQASLEVDQDRLFLWVLRTELGLTGGSCTVLVDGKPERSCQLPMRGIAGKKITTIEGLARKGELHPVQAAFVEHDALQCGFCTPGMILSAYGLLLENPKPTRRQILDHMEDNLCRCGAHNRIVRAIEAAAVEMGKGVPS
jgi:aerobic-type carbon monoxide dehydrogenase small subunit (CoxS/CutS family)